MSTFEAEKIIFRKVKFVNNASTKFTCPAVISENVQYHLQLSITFVCANWNMKESLPKLHRNLHA